MNNNYKFFQNRDCEFFPCHKVKDEDKFNCLFCYCPLYFDESCIGSPEYIVNGRGQKIKDCSSCLVVHRPEMYDKVIAHLQRQEEILHVDLRKLRQQIKDRLIQITHINDMEPDMCVEHQREAEIVLDRIMTKNASETSVECQVSVLLQPFAVECVHEGYFEFGRKRIKCNVLEQLDLDHLIHTHFPFQALNFNISHCTVLHAPTTAALHQPPVPCPLRRNPARSTLPSKRQPLFGRGGLGERRFS